MAVIVAGNEGDFLTSFSNGNRVNAVVGSTLLFSGTDQRAGWYLDDDQNTSATFDFPTGYQEIWVHQRIGVDYDTDASTKTVFSIRDTSDAIIAYIQVVWPNGGFPCVMNYSVLGSTPASITSALGNFSRTFDWHIRLSEGTDGFVKLYDEGSLKYEVYGANAVTTGVTQVGNIWFGSGNDGVGQMVHFCETLVSTTSTIGARVVTVPPTSDVSNGWDSGTYADVDETSLSDADYMATTTNGDEIVFGDSITLPTYTDLEVSAVVVAYSGAYEPGAAVTGLTPLLQDTTGTNTYYGTGVTATETFSSYVEIWDTDPGGSNLPWTRAAADAYNFGIRADT